MGGLVGADIAASPSLQRVMHTHNEVLSLCTTCGWRADAIAGETMAPLD
jgi:hypothetical protein